MMSIFETIVLFCFFMLIYGVFKLIEQVRGLHKQLAELGQRIAPYDMPEEIFQKAKDYTINDIGRSLDRIQSDLNSIEMYVDKSSLKG